MSQNSGKIFEQDIKKSVPKEYFYYRFKDGTANFGGVKNESVRFQAKNMCDCEVMTEEYLFLIELKSHLGKSISFTCIRNNQIEEMTKVNHKRIKTYFIFNFRDLEKTYGIESQKIKEYMETAKGKSFPVKWCEENGIEIESQKKKVRYKYNLEKFFKDATEQLI